MPHVGSDHFPILIDLHLDPQKQNDHEVLEQKEGDEEEAAKRIERAAEDTQMDVEPVGATSPSRD